MPEQKSILETVPGRPADHRITLTTIGQGALMNLGARDYVHDDKNGRLWFRIGAGNPHRKALIVLAANDTYTVEIGRLKRRTFEWITEATAEWIHAEQLAETLIRMHHQVTHG